MENKRAALVEKVRAANGCVACPPDEKCYCLALIEIVRAEVLEEAARVADTLPCKLGRDGPQIAAAIRALKDKP